MTHYAFGVPIVILSLWSAMPAAADDDAAEKVTRLAVDAGGRPYGSIVTRREPLPDGNLRIEQIARSRIDLLGRRQEIAERFEAVVTPAFAPVSCKYRSEGPSGTAIVEGAVKDRALVLTLRRDDLSLVRRVPLGDSLVFGACLGDVLAARTAASEVRLSILDSDSWTAEPAVARRLPEADGLRRWDVAYRRGWGGGIWSLTASGDLAGVEIRNPRRTVRPTTADLDERLEYWTLPDRELLLFPIKQDIPFPERLVELKVRLTWKGLPPESLQLEDSRQRIVRRTTEKDRHVVELALARPPEITDAPRLPVGEARFAASLGETTFILPRHPAIREQASKWTQGAETTLEAVRRLSHEVSRLLEGGEMIAETLSGPEVLACRKGKCGEFTTLLASLARSVGVPTRVALGMRLVGGRWVGHMWCEVWVGRWIPVDASADEVGGSPALLKLAHSDDERGSQAIRWALAESLEVEIIAAEGAKSGDARMRTGIAGQTYTHAEFACRIKAPTPEWRLTDRSKPGVVTIRFEPPGKCANGAPRIELIAVGMPVKMEPASLMSTVKIGLRARFPSMEIVADDDKSVGRVTGRLFTFRRDDPNAAGKKLKTSEFICLADGAMFLLMLTAEESIHDGALPQFEALLGGFEIVEGADAPPKK